MNRAGLIALACWCGLAALPAYAETPVACTEIGCVNGLSLTVPTDYSWQPGAYVFSLKLDGRTVTCKGKLPLNACDMPSVNCDGEGVVITESGCALPSPEAQGFGDIQIESGPQQVAVSVTRDGQTLVEKILMPSYRTARPNGPQCGPECRQASIPLFGQ